MKIWLRIGCFLTGYNFRIVSGASELVAKSVKRTTSALLIVCTLWAFIGYTFAGRYLGLEPAGRLVCAFIMCIIVIQIERQIILSNRPSRALYIFRAMIAVVMALIGSLIIDQLIFREDIELQKIKTLGKHATPIVATRSEELRGQERTLDTAIQAKEAERAAILRERPTSKTGSSEIIRKKIGHQISATTITRSVFVVNPKYAVLPGINDQIRALYLQKQQKDSMLLTIRPTVEKEIMAKKGFLNELQSMWELVRDSKIAAVVWLMWILFFLGIELFILMSKAHEEDDEYHTIEEHQMNLYKKRLELLSRPSSN